MGRKKKRVSISGESTVRLQFSTEREISKLRVHIEATPLHQVVVEACGGFELLRRLGLDLVE